MAGRAPRWNCRSRTAFTSARARPFNFETRLPAPHSELAHETLKDPYLFDFLGLGDDAHEREIENALVRHITRFLLELGTGSLDKDADDALLCMQSMVCQW